MKFVKSPIIALVIALFFFTTPAIADEALEHKVKELAHQLRCPTCQALSVKESEAGLATNMKTKIREMLVEGKSDEQVLQFFVDRYGEWILRSPPKTGTNLLLWLAPGVLTAFAAFSVIFVLKSKPKKANKTLKPLSDAEKAKIDQALDDIS
ncbi:MAG: cytochrome c-type biogenesis protein CcmH [SAR324 cluster bacterium]|nr:cytochrome c-type biogenesis protein CcmH [SAR324 cluster bacterium]